MIAAPNIDLLIGTEALDPDDDSLGHVSQVYVDSTSGLPTWASLRAGLLGTSEVVVPLEGASWDADGLHLAVAKGLVRNAPRVSGDQPLSTDEQDKLYAHYGMRHEPLEETVDDELSYSYRDDAPGVDLDRIATVDALAESRTRRLQDLTSTGGRAG